MAATAPESMFAGADAENLLQSAVAAVPPVHVDFCNIYHGIKESFGRISQLG
jgi:hypothetical protein